MPNIIIPLSPTYDSVTRHAVGSVIPHLLEQTGIDAKTPVRYRDADNDIMQPGTGLTDKEEYHLNHDDRVFITIKESFVDTAVINTPVRHDEELYIYEDQTLGAYSKPIYSYTKVEIEMTYRAKSRHDAEAWVHDVKVRIGDYREYFNHMLDFHYTMPKAMFIILRHLYDLRENIAGYGDTFTDYIKKHVSPTLSKITNQAGNGGTLIFKQKQVGVVGWFDFEEPEPPEKNDAGGSWTVNCNYVFEYMKPVSINMQYPLVVHQQLISDKLFDQRPLYRIENHNYDAGLMRNADWFGPTNEIRMAPERNFGGMLLPEWDEWLPKIVTNWTTTLTMAAILIDPDDPLYLMDAQDVDPFEWKDNFKAFLDRESKFATSFGKSFMYVQIYAGDAPMSDGILKMEDSYIYSTRPLNLRTQYHMRLAFIINFDLLDKDAIDRLAKDGKTTIDIFETLNPGGFDRKEYEDKLIGDGYLPPKWIEDLFDKLKDREQGKDRYPNGGGYPGTRPPGWNGGVDGGGRQVENYRIMTLTIAFYREQNNGNNANS